MKKLSVSLPALILMLFLCCCSLGNKASQTAFDNTNADYVLSHINQRTGIIEQNIFVHAGFECTESGIYYLLPTDNGIFLFYGDHGSDTIIKLCGRAECQHADSECNAYFENGSSLCYYNGSIYVAQSLEGKPGHAEVVKINVDGTNRVPVIDTHSLGSEYHGHTSPRLWNGVFTVVMNYIDDTGNTNGKHYYFKLDGTMKELEPCALTVPYANDGNAFLCFSTSENGKDDFYSWDPDTNTLIPVVSGVAFDEMYIGTEWCYQIQDGVILRFNDREGKEEILFDTGLSGKKALACFADCIVIRDHLSWEDYLNGNTLDECNLHFYNWKYELLGSIALDYPRDATFSYPICGETPERIILTDSYEYYPRYYIEKSDFGTGKIEIHEYNLPDLTEELTKLDAKLSGN